MSVTTVTGSYLLGWVDVEPAGLDFALEVLGIRVHDWGSSQSALIDCQAMMM